jgi:hypothetical protein
VQATKLPNFFLQYLLPTLTGFGWASLAVYPEIGLIILLGAFSVGLIFFGGLQHIRVEKWLFWIVSGVCAGKFLGSLVLLNFRNGILEPLAIFILCSLSHWIHSFDHKILRAGVFIGTGIALVTIVVPKTVFDFSGGDLFWKNEPELVIQRQINEITEFSIIEEKNAWALQNTTWQGSGKVRYQLEIRSKKPFQLNIAFIHAALPNGRADYICNVKTQWTLCSIKVNLSSRGATIVGIGGYDTWNSNNPVLQTRNSKVVLLTKPSLSEVLTDMTRTSGFAFNENAFGAHMTVVALLLVASLSTYFGSVALAIPALLSIFLSGSRGAFAAFVIGMLSLFVARSRFYKILPLILVVCFAVIGFLQLRAVQTTSVSTLSVIQQSGIRSLSINDSVSARGRLEIWRLALNSWLESPRTFLIGTGDLASAMKVEFDAQAASFGIHKKFLTHAHNLWFQTAGESGLIGLFGMIILWVWVIRTAWQARDAGALALLVAIFVINSVDYLFYYAPVHLAFWMAAVGFVRSTDASIGSQEKGHDLAQVRQSASLGQ